MGASRFPFTFDTIYIIRRMYATIKHAYASLRNLYYQGQGNLYLGLPSNRMNVHDA